MKQGLVIYKQGLFRKVLNSFYLKMIQKKDIYETFEKGSFLSKKLIVQEYAIDNLCAKCEFNRLKDIWPNISDFVKQEKHDIVKENLLKYMSNNLENIDELVMTLPSEFKSLYNSKKEPSEYIVSNNTSNSRKEIISYNELFRALTELKVILSTMSEEVVNCIPENFIKFIEENYDKKYIPDINPLLDINRQNLLEKTKILLALIYRKYVRL